MALLGMVFNFVCFLFGYHVQQNIQYGISEKKKNRYKTTTTTADGEK